MKTFALIAAAFALGYPAAGMAQDHRPDVAVSYADLDLTTPAGVARLDQRISTAVGHACDSDVGVRDIARLSATRACRTAKLEEAQAQRQAVLSRAARERYALAAKR